MGGDTEHARPGPRPRTLGKARSASAWLRWAPLVALAVLLLAGPAARAQETPRIQDDLDDFIESCQPGGELREGPLAMDVVGAFDLGERGGVRHFQVFTREDVGAFFASNPGSAAFVLTILAGPEGPAYQLIREIHQGQERNGIFDPQGNEVPGTGLRTTLGVGQVDFLARGLPPLGGEATWGVTTFVATDQQVVLCDPAGVDDSGVPVTPVDATGTGATESPSPATTESPEEPSPSPAPTETMPTEVVPTERAADETEKGGSSIVPYGLGLLLAVLLFLAGWWIRSGRRRVADTIDRTFPEEPPPPPGTAPPGPPPGPGGGPGEDPSEGPP